MKKQLLIGACVLSMGTISLMAYKEQKETIEVQSSQIDSLELQNKSLKKSIKQQQESLEKVSSELAEVSYWNDRLQENNKQLLEANKSLTNRLNKILKIEATAYTPLCNTGCTGTTKTGLNVTKTNYYKGKRIVAVDPRVIPLGTTMRVHTKEGAFLATAQDTGGDIKGNRMDILFLSERGAENFGRQQVTVEIL